MMRKRKEKVNQARNQARNKKLRLAASIKFSLRGSTKRIVLAAADRFRSLEPGSIVNILPSPLTVFSVPMSSVKPSDPEDSFFPILRRLCSIVHPTHHSTHATTCEMTTKTLNDPADGRDWSLLQVQPTPESCVNGSTVLATGNWPATA